MEKGEAVAAATSEPRHEYVSIAAKSNSIVIGMKIARNDVGSIAK